MKRPILSLLVGLFAILAVTAVPVPSQLTTNSIDSSYSQRFFNDLFLQDSTAIFRHLNFGMTKDQVMLLEKGHDVMEKENQFLAITLYFDEHEMEFADIFYDFNDSEGLSLITVETFQLSKQEAQSVIDLISAKLTKRYGKPTSTSPERIVWNNCMLKSGKVLFYELRNLSSPDDAGLYLQIGLAKK